MNASAMTDNGDAQQVQAVITGPYRTPIDVSDCDDDDPSATSVCLAIASVRALAGLPPLRRDEAASNAARGHCNYVRVNRALTHTQDPRKPAFTGVTFRDRLAASSFRDDPGGEVLASIVGGAAITGVSGFLNSVYHRAMFLRSETTSYGYGQSGECATIDLGRPRDYAEAAIATVVWPPDQARNVPTTFYADREMPNPLPGSSAVGAPVTFIGATSPSSIALYEGRVVVPGVLITTDSDPNKMVRRGEAHFVPTLPLKARTRYTVIITVAGETLTSSFTTAT
jgi:uncharacterized protein YkwD